MRNYHSDIDLSWQEVFQTSDPEQVNQYCHENGIETRWDSNYTRLSTRQVCQATTTHPISNTKVWFNQAHLFHISALEPQTLKTLINEFGENDLPRNAFYGDGSPIEIEILDHIRQIYNKEKKFFKWQKRDIMILDNLLMAHGRRPFEGERKVVVAMS